MRVEGSYECYGVEFDYIAYVEKGSDGDYHTPPSPDEIDIEFLGFLPDVDLYECVKHSIIDNIEQQILENL